MNLKNLVQTRRQSILQSYIDIPGKFETRFKNQDETVCKKVIPILLTMAIEAENYELAQKIQEHYNKAELTWKH